MNLTKKVSGRPQEALRVSFGTLISLQRRELHLSVEKLAVAANIELEDLLRIEDDSTYIPNPATVRRLAEALKLPASQLLVLSGNIGSLNDKLHKAALQFVDRVHEAEKLSPEHAKALHDFVQVLIEAA